MLQAGETHNNTSNTNRASWRGGLDANGTSKHWGPGHDHHPEAVYMQRAKAYITALGGGQPGAEEERLKSSRGAGQGDARTNPQTAPHTIVRKPACAPRHTLMQHPQRCVHDTVSQRHDAWHPVRCTDSTGARCWGLPPPPLPPFMAGTAKTAPGLGLGW